MNTVSEGACLTRPNARTEGFVRGSVTESVETRQAAARCHHSRLGLSGQLTLPCARTPRLMRLGATGRLTLGSLRMSPALEILDSTRVSRGLDTTPHQIGLGQARPSQAGLAAESPR